MKKNKLKSLVILFSLTFSLLNLPLGKLFPAVKATYVEGTIDKDTVWTLVDSPFIVSQNVSILQGVTLTIEPGVEVRFGEGPFTIIVSGRLFAQGTEEKPIRFTSNKENPQAGDWATILFNGTVQQPSLLEYCLVEYGTDGITVNGSTVTVQKSVLQFNLRNGITVLDGSITVRQTVLKSNNEGGIVVLGGNATIENNNITLNEDGVILAGSLSTSHVNVAQNNIFSNRKSGVFLAMDVSSSDVSVRNNLVFSNFYGFYISTNASTFVARNYIYNNNIGAFYERGEMHVIRFNDIWGNVLGMDASPNARVNATQNYWGDKSGPYHESLNPRGKGNPVMGNGVNIDFIFFLTNSIDHENSPPTAVLWTDKTLVAPGQEVTFVGSYSSDEGRVDKYYFEFGDGGNSGWTTLSLFFHKYNSAGDYIASLRVMDDFGDVSTAASTVVRVVDLPSLNVELLLGSRSVYRNGEISVTVRVSDGSEPVEGANVTLLSVKGGSFSQPSGLTDSSGVFVATFKAPDVMDITNIRIIARASMDGYTDGSNFDYLEVIPPLTVEIHAEPQTVLSEEFSTVNVRVTWSGAPISEALVAVSSSDGNFTEAEKFTDLNGEAKFTFKAPPSSSETNITIAAHATKAGYIDGNEQTVIVVMPKVLSIWMAAEKATLVSEETVNLTVNVRYEGFPVKDVNIAVSAESGECSPAVAFTNTYGNATFTFKAPPVLQETNITITATSSKPGYAHATSFTMLTVKPGNLTITVFPSTYSAKPEEMLSIAVYVKCDGRPVSNATVTVNADAGTFAETSALTSLDGRCDFTFWAPRASEPISITVTVNAAKFGYVEAVEQISLQVIPEVAGGIPWLTILLILIPVVLVIVLVVLIKLGVISVSFGGEEE